MMVPSWSCGSPWRPRWGESTRARASRAALGSGRRGSRPGSAAARAPSDDPRPGTASERGPRERPPAAVRPSGPASARAVPARPAPGAAPAPAVRSGSTASAPRPDTPAGSRTGVPWSRRSWRSSSRPPHRQREAALRGTGALPQQFHLHRQLPNVTLGRVQRRDRRFPSLILQPKLETGQGPLLPRLQAI